MPIPMRASRYISKILCIFAEFSNFFMDFSSIYARKFRFTHKPPAPWNLYFVLMLSVVYMDLNKIFICPGYDWLVLLFNLLINPR